MSTMIKLGLTAAAAGIAVLGTAGMAAADTDPFGVAQNSPGVVSGNNLQVPVHIPVNACGNSVDVIGLLNPALGNVCANK
ncbi:MULTISPECIES: chaplin [unclassified Streptomyces]|uniref:chaplin n=1 Tax=unclassified Streptomyces TaxID=2593676 RepID=UPI003BB73D7A